MTLAWSDGFDRLSLTADLTLRYQAGAATTYGAAVGAFSGGGVTIGTGLTAWLSSLSGGISLPHGAGAEVHVAAWMKWTDFPNHASPFFGFATDQVALITSGSINTTLFNDLKIDANGALSFSQTGSSTDLGVTSANNVILLNNWHHVEFVASYRNASGYYKVYVDGVLALSFTGDVVAGTDPTSILGFVFHAGDQAFGDTMTFVLDDPLVWDIVGDDFAWTQLPYLHQIEVLSVTSDTRIEWDITTAAGSPSVYYTEVDDPAMNDGDSTYIQSSASGEIEMFGVADQASTPIATLAIAIHSVAKKTNAGSAKLRNCIKKGTVTHEGSDHTLTTSYAVQSDYYGTDQSGVSPTAVWGPTDINSIEVGVKNQGA